MSDLLDFYQFENDENQNTNEIRTEELDQNYSLKIQQNLQPGCGGKVWEAAGLLCHFLRYYYTPSLLSQNQIKTVVELGSGTGVVGLCMSQLLLPLDSEACVYLTDLPFYCSLMEQNIHLNHLGKHLELGQLKCLGLCWGEEIPKELQQKKVDVVLVSDCVYLESCFEPLLKTLEDLIGTETVCWMSYKKRRRADRLFFYKLKKLFNVQLRTDYPAYERVSKERLFLYEIRKR